MATETVPETPIFKNLDADDDDCGAVEVESLCMNCHASGITRMMLTKIPFYREVIVMSFSCKECGFANNELRDAGVVDEKGIRFTLLVKSPKDLNRRCVRTDYAAVSIPELELELPSLSQRGEVTTIEGILDRVIKGLEQDQPKRREEHPEDAAKIDEFLEKLQAQKELREGPFTIIITDISGNSHVENPDAPSKDPNCTTTYFDRELEHDHALGIFTQNEINDEEVHKLESEPKNKDSVLMPIKEGEHSLKQMESGEVMTFRTNCPDCNAPCDTNMKVTDIPHFKEVLIMATNCDQCGHRTNEVKSGGGIELLGVKIEVKIRGKADFSRDILKSDTCTLLIPELELEQGPRSLCGRFTTAEGLLRATRDQLCGKEAMLVGDSVNAEDTLKMENFLKRLDDIIDGNESATIILDDPAGNSYVQTLTDDGSLDEGITIVKYERNHEQNEELGLNDMKTENYDDK